MPQFNIERGHLGPIHALAGLDIPLLAKYRYNTFAPYDVLQKEPTLMLNRFSGAFIKHPAMTSVDYLPGERLSASSVLGTAPSQVLIGEVNMPFKSSSPISKIDFNASIEETDVSFYDKHDELVDMYGLSADDAFVAVRGLVRAVQMNLIDHKNSGREFRVVDFR